MGEGLKKLPVAVAGLAGYVRIVLPFRADSRLPAVPRIDSRLIRQDHQFFADAFQKLRAAAPGHQGGAYAAAENRIAGEYPGIRQQADAPRRMPRRVYHLKAHPADVYNIAFPQEAVGWVGGTVRYAELRAERTATF